MSPTTTTGTSLEVLAPLLPFGAEMQYAGHTGIVFRCLLIGLNKSHARLLHLDKSIQPQYQSVPVESVLPVLYSFEDLVKPLPDGTVPAHHIAMLLANDWAACYSYTTHEVRGNRFTVRLMEWDVEEGETLVGDISILADWNFFLEDEGKIMHFENVLQSYDYLRSKHFAVGLQAHQYIRKTN